jgi:PTS system mannose-specific IIA component
MIGVLVVSHGRLADGFVETLTDVLGNLPRVEAVSSSAYPDPEAFRRGIREAVARLDEGEGVLILTDMFGDTATNLSLAMSREMPCEVVSGLNMPMLFKAVTARTGTSLGGLAQRICEYGRSHIVWATRRWAGETADG